MITSHPPHFDVEIGSLIGGLPDWYCEPQFRSYSTQRQSTHYSVSVPRRQNSIRTVHYNVRTIQSNARKIQHTARTNQWPPQGFLWRRGGLNPTLELRTSSKSAQHRWCWPQFWSLFSNLCQFWPGLATVGQMCRSRPNSAQICQVWAKLAYVGRMSAPGATFPLILDGCGARRGRRGSFLGRHGRQIVWQLSGK